MERNQIHYEPPEETGDDPFHETATAWQMPIKVGKGKARGSRPIEIRKQPGHQGMNIFPSPVTQRRLEALIGLKEFSIPNSDLPTMSSVCVMLPQSPAIMVFHIHDFALRRPSSFRRGTIRSRSACRILEAR